MFDELLNDFLVEAGENLSRLDADLVALEKNPEDAEVLKNIFRAIHTVKGTCGMFGLSRLEKVAHAAEDVLVRLRDGKLAVHPGTIGPVLRSIDVIKEILQELEKSRKEPEGNDTALIQELRALCGDSAAATSSASASSNGATPAIEAVPESAPKASAQPESPAEGGTSISDQTLRVRVDVLDRLMNLVGEMVLTRNQLVQLVRGDDESKYLGPIQQLNRVTSGLQESVMKTRMQPIGNAWSKLPRVVRDLSVSSGKDLKLIMNGKETEIDRQVLQAIQDPLVHCVRNSADHGIEMPAIRAAAGKPTQGTIILEAFHEGGQMIIQIRDDGAGIDVQAVKAKAIERGLLKADAADQLTDQQLVQFIFEPGFSTAKKVTEVSGRGVGMDVVRSNIQKIGGSIEITTVKGSGTTIRIGIPLTLAIISALVIKAGGEGGEVFAIPQIGVLELVRVSESNQDQIEEIHGSRFYRLREELLPLIDLSATLSMRPTGREFTVMVAQVGDGKVGLMVDEVFDTQEIVVKPVGRTLRQLNLYSGSTILGDGTVILILDLGRVAAKALSEGAFTRTQKEAVISEDTGLRRDRAHFLVFRSCSGNPCAVPVALVSRLEEFKAETIERAGGRCLVQYRGGLLPLLSCPEGAEFPKSEQTVVPALIFSDGKRSIGLVVDEILDIVDDTLSIEPDRSKPGVLGVSVIQGKATEIVDTYHFIRAAYPDWFDGQAGDTEAGRGVRRKKRLLLVDDSPFFRELLRPLLEAQGFEVTTAGDGADGFAILERGESFDLVLSDIDMPKLDGVGFARRVRTELKRTELPMIALSASKDPDIENRALTAGFDQYLVKFEQDEVFRVLSRFNGRGPEVAGAENPSATQEGVSA
jgi:two-component system chemotaxis sensor kinase CheA